jgi:hypothetical protein
MSYWRHPRSSPQGLCLLVCLFCGGTTAAWAVGTAAGGSPAQDPASGTGLPSPSAALGDPSPSRSAANRRTAPSASAAARVPNPTVTDPCAPAAPTMQTKATPEASRHSSSALAGLVTHAKAQQGTSRANPENGGPLVLDLWSSRIAVPGGNEDAATSLALQRLIRQVHTLATNDKSAAQPPASAPKPPPARPPTVVAAHAEAAEPGEAQAAATTASETASELPPEAQKILAGLQKNPSRIGDPLETAELLFLSGRPTDAAAFYQEALRRTRAGDSASADDRAWILFQLGNCLRETDSAKAQDAYAKLMAEFPNSPWTEMARAGSRLLTWYQSTRPDQLMTTRKP